MISRESSSLKGENRISYVVVYLHADGKWLDESLAIYKRAWEYGMFCVCACPLIIFLVYLCCRCTEAVSLLALPRGSACLLADLLNDASPDCARSVISSSGGVVSEDAVTAAVSALNDVHVHALSPSQAGHVLLHRLYTNGGTS